MKSVVTKFAGIGLALVAWQALAVSEVVPTDYFPLATDVLKKVGALLLAPAFTQQLAATCLRMIAGLALAIVIAMPLALLTARLPILRKALAPLVDIMRVLPPPAIIPIAIFGFGIGHPLFMFIVTFAALWPIYVNADNALSTAEPIQVMSSRSFGYSDIEILVFVRLPAALPEIVTGIRLGAGSALLATIAAEMLAGQTGLGFMLYDAAFTLRVTDMYAIMVMIGVLGFAINGAVRLASYTVVGWNIKMTALGSPA